jgi:hypothetical protein
MYGTCSTNERGDKCMQNFDRKTLTGRGLSKDLDIDGKKILQ